MESLTPSLRRALRARAHALNPVVSISHQGLSAAVLKEIDLNLRAHELIKIRVYGAERDDRESLMAELCSKLCCAPVQHIGNILVIFRENPEIAEKEVATKKPSASKSAPSQRRRVRR